MRKILSYALLLVFVFYGVGCDSNSDDPSVKELLAGDWELSSISDAQGDRTEVIMSLTNGLDITFDSDGTFSIFVDSKTEGADVTLNGTWTVNESQNRIALEADYSGTQLALDFTYAFTNDDVVRLTASSFTSLLLNQLLSAGLEGSVTITIERA